MAIRRRAGASPAKGGMGPAGAGGPRAQAGRGRAGAPSPSHLRALITATLKAARPSRPGFIADGTGAAALAPPPGVKNAPCWPARAPAGGDAGTFWVPRSSALSTSAPGVACAGGDDALPLSPTLSAVSSASNRLASSSCSSAASASSSTTGLKYVSCSRASSAALFKAISCSSSISMTSCASFTSPSSMITTSCSSSSSSSFSPHSYWLSASAASPSETKYRTGASSSSEESPVSRAPGLVRKGSRIPFHPSRMNRVGAVRIQHGCGYLGRTRVSAGKEAAKSHRPGHPCPPLRPSRGSGWDQAVFK
jgi:hypothetical protein